MDSDVIDDLGVDALADPDQDGEPPSLKTLCWRAVCAVGWRARALENSSAMAARLLLDSLWARWRGVQGRGSRGAMGQAARTPQRSCTHCFAVSGGLALEGQGLRQCGQIDAGLLDCAYRERKVRRTVQPPLGGCLQPTVDVSICGGRCRAMGRARDKCFFRADLMSRRTQSQFQPVGSVT